MRTFLRYYLAVVGILVAVTGKVWAGDEACDTRNCMSTRVINQWACQTCSTKTVCSGDHSKSCTIDDNSCSPYGPCMELCLDGTTPQKTCGVLDADVGCNNTGVGHCSWDGNLKDCRWSGGNCTDSSTPASLGCCGPGDGTTPKGCGGSCSTGADCSSGYCSGVCRNANCPSEGDCTCPTTPSHTRSVVGLV